ncbi:hypothetical protein ACQ4PT_064935 [Festuca glaucescens]
MVSKIKRQLASLPTLAKAALLLLTLLLLLAAILLPIFLIPRHRRQPLQPATPPADNCSTSTGANTAVAFDFSPFLVKYRSGCVHRMDGTERVPAGVDEATGVTSKDVVIDSDTGLAARMYLPPPLAAGKTKDDLLPVLVFYHGGAFVIMSPFEPKYHAYLNALVAKARVVAVSVDYRLAPSTRFRPPTTTRGRRSTGWPATRPAGRSRGCGTAGTSPGCSSPATAPAPTSRTTWPCAPGTGAGWTAGPPSRASCSWTPTSGASAPWARRRRTRPRGGGTRPRGPSSAPGGTASTTRGSTRWPRRPRSCGAGVLPRGRDGVGAGRLRGAREGVRGGAQRQRVGRGGGAVRDRRERHVYFLDAPASPKSAKELAFAPDTSAGNSRGDPLI